MRTCLLLTLVLCACSSTTERGSQAPFGSEEARWIQPSADLERQLHDRAVRLGYTHHTEEKYSLVSWFAAQGEVAYPTLLEVVEKGTPEAAELALSALASSNDPRLLSPLKAIPFPGTDVPLLRLERARCHMVLGDWDHADVLIGGLEHASPLVRGITIKALRQSTRLNFGFDPRKEPGSATEAVDAWRRWDAERRADPLRS